MKLLIDNNVIIDVFQDRKPFSEHSSKILELTEIGYCQGFVTANSITDIHYVLKRALKDNKKAYEYIKLLLKIIDIIDVTSEDIYRALDSESKDFEDELISVCAYKANIDYIISRNTKDFHNSKVKAIEPDFFIKEIMHENDS
jgi:predicted nucleic acid-binding protein